MAGDVRGGAKRCGRVDGDDITRRWVEDLEPTSLGATKVLDLAEGSGSRGPCRRQRGRIPALQAANTMDLGQGTTDSTMDGSSSRWRSGSRTGAGDLEQVAADGWCKWLPSATMKGTTSTSEHEPWSPQPMWRLMAVRPAAHGHKEQVSWLGSPDLSWG